MSKRQKLALRENGQVSVFTVPYFRQSNVSLKSRDIVTERSLNAWWRALVNVVLNLRVP